MNILEVQNLCKTYGKGEAAVQALRNVTFSVHKGEFVAIVGESGSGKSTLLNVVGALDNPTAGKVLIDGKDIFSMEYSYLSACIGNWYCVIYFFSCGTKPRKTFT